MTKQAIYGFRGADIFTYISGAAKCERPLHPGAQLALKPRPGGGGQRPVRAGEGSFIYEADIPFLPVEAQGKSQALLLDGRPPRAALLAAHRPAHLQRGLPEQDGRATAAEIHRLLTLAREGKAMLGSEAESRDIAPCWCAPAPRASWCSRSWRASPSPSVYLSNRESVLAQVEAREIC